MRRRFERRPCKRCGVKTRQRQRPPRPGRRPRWDCTRCEGRRRERDRTKLLWRTMIYRCHNPAANNWRWYGGRGIKVCDRWRESYEAFLEDVGPRPSSDHSLDRLDRHGDYEPGNVRWATTKEQSFDHVRWLVVYGERKRIEAWVEGTELTRDEVILRLKDGWTPAQAVTVPPGEGRNYFNRRHA